MALADRLDPDKIAANLKTKRIGRTVVVHDVTSSTNDVAAAYARNPAHDSLVVFAEQQTAGRGRTGATWQSAHGASLLFSFVLIDCGLESELLSLVCAVAVAEALGQIAGSQTQIKWPNDIMLAGKKIGGILVESKVPRGDSVKYQVSSVKTSNFRLQTSDFIVGIGINCHQQRESFPPELRETATSIDLASGARCDRTILARRVLASLDHWLTTAESDDQRVIDAWNRLSTQRGQRVTLAYNGRTFTGTCIGVDPAQGLILQLDRGGIRMFDAAHTHIVK
ncbi:MAG: biotin--[acetyl-CoA-carboxylase] ligase [Sedimentisphaerales bacterium]|nr:biotin--[acetyl-CoA-carboxylase] ligase [Sedimentisphaerales bacterium]